MFKKWLNKIERPLRVYCPNIYTESSLEEVQCHNSLGTFNVEGLPFEPVLSDVSLNIWYTFGTDKSFQ